MATRRRREGSGSVGSRQGPVHVHLCVDDNNSFGSEAFSGATCSKRDGVGRHGVGEIIDMTDSA